MSSVIYITLGAKKARVINKGCIVIELNRYELLDEFIEKHWKNGKTEFGERKINAYKKSYNDYTDNEQGEEEEDDDSDNTEFAYEADLRDYLAKNLNVIESGLTLYKDEKGKPAVEYPVGSKRIDILAIDKNKTPVIIELKVKRGYERVIGQCQYYKNKIKELFKTNRVRVIIIAREITEYLQIGTMDMSEYELFEYKLNVKLERKNGE